MVGFPFKPSWWLEGRTLSGEYVNWLLKRVRIRELGVLVRNIVARGVILIASFFKVNRV